MVPCTLWVHSYASVHVNWMTSELTLESMCLCDVCIMHALWLLRARFHVFTDAALNTGECLRNHNYLNRQHFRSTKNPV